MKRTDLIQFDRVFYFKGKTTLLWFSVIFLFFISSCGKDFLDEKPNKALLVPTTLGNFQSLLDNQLLNKLPGLNIIASNDLIHTGNLDALPSPLEKGTYLWLEDMYSGPGLVPDWEQPYQQIFYANIVLDGLKELKPGSYAIEDFNRLKGGALFFRGSALFNLAQNFAKPYNALTDLQDAGVPIRLNSDVNELSVRGNIRQTYDRIVMDLEEAASLLNTQEYYKSRPSKHAALAMLARVYLTMQLYEKAEFYADSSLQINRTLIDYNTLNATAANPLPSALLDKNAEGIFYGAHISYSFFKSALTTVEPSLYQSYTSNDLRKTVFFGINGAGLINFKGSYNGNSDLFGGLATDEMYLIRAECLARRGNITGSMTDLNDLLLKRWKNGTYIPYTASGTDDALKKILIERRKELVCRGLRWNDLRRLNKDPQFSVTLSRTYNGQTYTLLPNSDLYVFPIPENEIRGSGIEQNPR